MKHTPGPWRTEECSGGGLLVIRDHPVSGSQTHIQVFPKEDARLMATAPQMLEALKAMTEWAYNVNDFSNEGGLLGDEYDAALAAIAKAEAE